MTFPMPPYRHELWEEQDVRRTDADMALTEREHAFFGVPKEGDRRVKGYPPYSINPVQNFRTSNVPAYNFYPDVLSRNWIQGSFEDGDAGLGLNFFKPAYWDGTHPAFDFNWGIDEQDGRYGHKPSVIALVDDGDDVHVADEHSATGYAGLYFTAQASADGGGGVATSLDEAGGFVGHWNGYAVLVAGGIDTNAFMRRTVTEDAVDDGTHYGWGFNGSFAAGVSLTTHDPTALPRFPTYVSGAARDADLDKKAGYGHVWIGFPRVLFYYSSRWYALAQGYIYDRGSDPLDNGGGEFPRYCACSLWVCNEGEAPTNTSAWANARAVFAPFDVDGPYDAIHDAADKEFSYFGLWPEQFGGKVYFSANPCNLPTELGLTDGDITNDVCVWVLDGGGLTASLHWYDTRCAGGPLVQYGSRLYFPMLSVPEQKLFIWRLDSAPSSWSLIASLDVGLDDGVEGSRPFIVTAWGHNGRISVVYGKRPSIFSNAYDGTDPASTAWTMKTLNLSSGTWRTLNSAVFPPGFDSDDHGIWPRLFPLKLTDLTGGGGGGGGTGPCDTTYFVHGTPSISKPVFATHMSGSPLLGEHTSDWFYDACVAVDVNPAFFLAIISHESQRGTVPGEVAGAFNVGNIRREYWGRQIGPWPTVCCGVFGAYANWSDGALDFMDLCNLSIYIDDTISQFITTYAPAFENATTDYISSTCSAMATWAAESGL